MLFVLIFFFIYFILFILFLHFPLSFFLCSPPSRFHCPLLSLSFFFIVLSCPDSSSHLFLLLLFFLIFPVLSPFTVRSIQPIHFTHLFSSHPFYYFYFYFCFISLYTPFSRLFSPSHTALSLVVLPPPSSSSLFLSHPIPPSPFYPTVTPFRFILFFILFHFPTVVLMCSV